MKYRLVITPAADADVDSAAAFIARDNIQAALRFYDAIDVTFRQIREHPNRSPRYELEHARLSGLRRRAVARFENHLVFYRVEGEAVVVIRVLHGARDIAHALEED
jgi:toxin ParE1/3/4